MNVIPSHPIPTTPELEAMLTVVDARAYLLQMYKPETGSLPKWLDDADSILIASERETRKAALEQYRASRGRK